MWDKIIIAAGALLAGVAVILGAFAAHGLKSTLDAEALNAFETGVRYQMYHAITLILVGVLYQHYSSSILTISAGCFFGGIVLFSGSLYLLATLEEKASLLGPITPIGGLLFILGWALLAVAMLQQLKY